MSVDQMKLKVDCYCNDIHVYIDVHVTFSGYNI